MWDILFSFCLPSSIDTHISCTICPRSIDPIYIVINLKLLYKLGQDFLVIQFINLLDLNYTFKPKNEMWINHCFTVLYHIIYINNVSLLLIKENIKKNTFSRHLLMRENQPKYCVRLDLYTKMHSTDYSLNHPDWKKKIWSIFFSNWPWQDNNRAFGTFLCFLDGYSVNVAHVQIESEEKNCLEYCVDVILYVIPNWKKILFVPALDLIKCVKYIINEIAPYLHTSFWVTI